MVTLTRIYTRGGDGGETSLADGTRVAKSDLRVEAFGTVDEANSTIGLVRLHTADEAALADLDAFLSDIQNDLFDLGGDLATPTGEGKEERLSVTSAHIERLENEIDRLNDSLAPLSSFVLPGGSPASAYLHLARAQVRRAERLAVDLAAGDVVNEAVIRYLNRLSDYLFVAARWANDPARPGGTGDVLWVPGKNRGGA